MAVATKWTNLWANIRFTGVCRSWRLAGLQDRHRLIGRRRQIPGLIIAPSKNSLVGGTRQVISVTDIISNNEKRRNRRRVVPWQLAEWSLCIGGSITMRGWILVLDCDLKMVLVNPVPGSQFPLPEDQRIDPRDFASWGFWHSRRVTIWAPPDHSADWFVFVLLPGAYWKSYIKYCRVGGNGNGSGAGWDVMKFPVCEFGLGFIADALCSSVEAGHLYVLISTGELFCCNFFTKTTTRVVAATASSSSQQVEAFKSGQEFNYIVEVEGQIVMLHRNRERQGCAEVYKPNRGFDVYRLHRVGMRWVETKEFGDSAVFLGFGQPFSIPITEELESSGIQANRIYFLELPEEYSKDQKRCVIGVFHLQTSTIDFFQVASGFSMPCAGMPVRVPIPIAPMPW